MADASSLSSGPSTSSLSGSSTRVTPVPNTYKPLTRSPSVTTLTKLTDDDLRRQGTDEVLRIVRRLESENRNNVSEHNTIMKDVNRRMQILMLEIRGLKDINQNLQDDNQELRDLCCFLDDDRQRGRKLAREWQRFGRYTASVMRSEVSAYQDKLKALETKQEELISDNTELKELCLFLDQERLRFSQPRDEGDGSSSSTVAGGDEHPVHSDRIELVPVHQLQPQTDSSTGRTHDYIRQLESQIRHLEDEKKHILMDGNGVEGSATISTDEPDTQQVASSVQRVGPDGIQPSDGAHSASPSKPEAVVHAMKVLQVHDQLERPHTSIGEENLDDKEKAIVREMCNVVWRKLGNVSADNGAERGSEASTPHPVYENISTGHDRVTPPLPSPPPPTHHAPPPPRNTRNAPPPANKAPPPPVSQVHPVQEPYHGNLPPHYDQLPPQRPPTSSQSQRSNPTSTHAHRSVSSATQVQKPTPHHAQPPPYGHVRTSRSAPVTPIPREQSQPPPPSAASAAPTHNYANIPRSEVQLPPPDPTMHPSKSVPQGNPDQGDHSYENVVVGQRYDGPQGERYYYTTSQNGSGSQPGGAADNRYDYPPPPPPHNTRLQSYASSTPSPVYTGNPYNSQPPSRPPQGKPLSRPSQDQYAQSTQHGTSSAQQYAARNTHHQQHSSHNPSQPQYSSDNAPTTGRSSQHSSHYSVDAPLPGHNVPPPGRATPPPPHSGPSQPHRQYMDPPSSYHDVRQPRDGRGYSESGSRDISDPRGQQYVGSGSHETMDLRGQRYSGTSGHDTRDTRDPRGQQYSAAVSRRDGDNYYGQNYK